MFSRAERRFLAIHHRAAREGRDVEPLLAAAFPNPSYRRKLRWGIRRKAARASADWALYVGAARTDASLVPGAPAAAPVPLVADPLVPLLRALGRTLGRRRAGARAGGRRGPEPEGRP